MVTIKFHDSGFNEVRNLPAVLSLLGAEASRRAARCGPDYEMRGPETGPRRGRAAVITGNREARIAEAKHHHLARG